MKKSVFPVSVPRSILNWRLFEPSNPSPYVSELFLYSDASFIAEAGQVGPYAFLNTVAHGGVGSVDQLKLAIAFRFRHCVPNTNPDMSTSNFSHYHGGTEFDEIASLVSLELGCRIQAGPVVRDFSPNADPMGRPRQINFDRVPSLPPFSGRPIIPQLMGQRDLRGLVDIVRLPQLSDENSTALIKAARLYQQAIWLADTAPELSWILLVSAIEAIVDASPKETLDKVADLKLFYAKVAAILTTDQLAPVAKELSGLFGSTRKFVDFLTQFAPPPPQIRPEFGRFNFSSENIKKTAAKIYQYRSRALHGGVAFPAPMCSSPSHMEEIPTGLAAYSKGATWMAADLPCHLHIFEHLVRGSMLNWIHSKTVSSMREDDSPERNTN